MGLVEITEKMTTSVTIPGTGSKNPASSGSSVNTIIPTSNSSPDQGVRKKRTFDIAFLTGQSEKESNFSNDSNAGDLSDRDSPSNGGGGLNSNNNNIERKFTPFASSNNVHSRSHSPYNLTQDGTNSDSSSIDVMTNGSLSESESRTHSPTSSIPEQPSPPLHPAVLIHQQHQLSRSNVSGAAASNGGFNHRSSHNFAQDQHHHHADIKSNGSSSLLRASGTASIVGGMSNKNRNNRSPVKEEIRFESRRTIDINQTVDSLKIKENLQFSTLLPSSAAVGLALSGGATSATTSAGNGSGVSEHLSGSSNATRTISVTSGTDLSLPHLASTIALLPHVARFPLGLPAFAAASASAGVLPGGSHLAAAAAAANNIPFHAKMEKSESINISYPKLRVGPFPDPYAALAASTSGGYPYPNLLGVPPDLGRHPSFSSPLGSPVGTGHSGGGGGGPGAGQQVGQQPPPTIPPCGMSPSTTLLPPSLTSLTLPAQNVCAKCNIGFRMTSDLVYHMRSHHKRDTDPVKRQREEKLKCPVCHETFRERHHLTRHMTAHQDRAEET